MKIPYSFLKLNKYSIVIPTVITTQTVCACVCVCVCVCVHAATCMLTHARAGAHEHK